MRFIRNDSNQIIGALVSSPADLKTLVDTLVDEGPLTEYQADDSIDVDDVLEENFIELNQRPKHYPYFISMAWQDFSSAYSVSYLTADIFRNCEP